MKLTLLLLKFLFIGGLFIVSNYNLHLSHNDEMRTFGNLYYSWLEGLFDHTRQITGFIVSSQWLPPSNSTFEESSDTADVLVGG